MKKSLLVRCVFLSVLFITSLACGFCPPAGPWPQPPGCGAAVEGARDDMGCFPPSCDMIPDERARMMCEQFKAGKDVWDWPRDCTLLPTDACAQLCESEKQHYIEVGHQNWEEGIKNNTDWWKEPYTKVYIFGTVTERLELFEADARPWGAAPDEEDLLKIEIAYSHYYNMPYAGNNFFNYVESIDPETGYHMVAYQEDQVAEELKPAMRRTLEGGSARGEYIEGVNDPEKLGLLFNAYHPAFLDRNIGEWKRLVDFEADGVMIDNLMGIPKGKDLATRFDDYTMQEFSIYLQQSLTEAEWQAVGAQPDDFNYAEFLRSRGYTSESFLVEDGSWEEIPLALEFRKFIAGKNAGAFQEMSEAIKAYAESQGRTITVSANMTDRVGTASAEPFVDFVSSEFRYISEPPYAYKTVVPFSKFSKAKAIDYLNVVVIGNYLPLNQFIQENPDLYVDVYRMGIMESYAARSSQIFLRADGLLADFGDDPFAVYRLKQDTTRLEQIKPAYDFMRRYKPYFANFKTSTARAAILYFNNLAYEFFLEDPSDQHYWDALRLGEVLYRLGVDFEVIAPDMPLDQYDVIVLPRMAYIPEGDAQTLSEFVKAGGKLMILNQPGEGGSLLQPGAQGSGEIIEFDADDKTAQAEYIRDQVGSLQSDRTPPISAVTYADGQGNLVVHLFSGYTDLSAGFPILENVSITLPFPIEGLKVSYASLEHPDLTPLEAGNLVIPDIKTYGMLLIEKP